MVNRYIYENNDLEEYVGYLDFDPMYFLDSNNIRTMSDLFNMGVPLEDDPNSRTVRYCDEDVCFEIKFIYLKEGAKSVGEITEENHEQTDFYFDGSNYYYIDCGREL